MTPDLLIGSNPDSPQVVGSITFNKPEAEELPDGEKAKQLPTPVGYKILCAIPEVEKVYENGIVKADVTIDYEEKLATVLFVVAMGPDCYADKTRYPSGAWCKVGDFIVVRPHIGTRLLIHGKEFRSINDDCVEMTVQDPRGIKRA